MRWSTVTRINPGGTSGSVMLDGCSQAINNVPFVAGQASKGSRVPAGYIKGDWQRPVAIGRRAVLQRREPLEATAGAGYWDQEHMNYRKSRYDDDLSDIDNTTLWTATLDEAYNTNTFRRLTFKTAINKVLTECIAFITYSGSAYYLNCYNANTGTRIFKITLTAPPAVSAGSTMTHNYAVNSTETNQTNYNGRVYDLYYYNDKLHVIHWLRDIPTKGAQEGTTPEYLRETGYYLLNIVHYEYNISGTLTATNTTREGLIEWQQHPTYTYRYYPYTTLGGLSGYLIPWLTTWSYASRYMALSSFVMKDQYIYASGEHTFFKVNTTNLAETAILIPCIVARYDLINHTITIKITPSDFTANKVVWYSHQGIACCTSSQLVLNRGTYLVTASPYSAWNTPDYNTARGLTAFSLPGLTVSWEDTTNGISYNSLYSAQNTAFERIYGQRSSGSTNGNRVDGYDSIGSIQFHTDNIKSDQLHACYAEDDFNVILGYDSTNHMQSINDGTSGAPRNWASSETYKVAKATGSGQIYCGSDYYTKSGTLTGTYDDSAAFFCFGSSNVYVTFTAAGVYKIRALT